MRVIYDIYLLIMIIFLYGEETFRSSSKLQKLKKDFLAQNLSSEPIVFDCDEECNTDKIRELFSLQDLFAPKKMIIVKNFIQNTKADDQKKIQKLLENKTDDTIVLWEDDVPKKNAVLFKWLQKNAQQIFESAPLEAFELEKWIVQTCKERQISIMNDSIKELIIYIGNDLWKMSGEIDKLGSYCQGREVSVSDVQKLVRGRVDADMFETVGAVVSGNRSRAITLLKKQLAKGDEAFHVFSMYAYQLRTLLVVSSVMEEEKIYDKNSVAKVIKVHPFVAQKSIAVLQKVSQDHLKKMHKKLTFLDLEIKKGKRHVHEALDIFITSV